MKLAKWESLLRRRLEKQERNARTVARWNGRVLLYLMTPLIALGPLFPYGHPWQFAITIPVACVLAYCCVKLIRWGEQPPRNVDEILEIARSRGERFEQWFRWISSAMTRGVQRGSTTLPHPPAAAGLERETDKPDATDSKDFKPGDKVTITAGTFSGFGGTVTGRDGDQVMLTLEIFGRATPPIPIPAADLRLESRG